LGQVDDLWLLEREESRQGLLDLIDLRAIVARRRDELDREGLVSRAFESSGGRI
jgi:hypothetical protein